jgi:hypothetical protein
MTRKKIAVSTLEAIVGLLLYFFGTNYEKMEELQYNW